MTNELDILWVDEIVKIQARHLVGGLAKLARIGRVDKHQGAIATRQRDHVDLRVDHSAEQILGFKALGAIANLRGCLATLRKWRLGRRHESSSFHFVWLSAYTIGMQRREFYPGPRHSAVSWTRISAGPANELERPAPGP